MRILLGISILVLIAILWTGVSILRHIRLTRRRNKFLREQQDSEQAQAMRVLVSATNVTPLPARFAAPLVPFGQHGEGVDVDLAAPEAPAVAQKAMAASVEISAPAQVTETVPQRPFSYPLTSMSSRRNPAMPTPQPIQAAPAEAPRATMPSPAPAPRIHPPEPPPLRIMEVMSEPGTRDIFPSAPAFPTLAAHMDVPPPPIAAPPLPSAPNVRRPVRSVHSQPSGVRPAHRPDWIYFNKDMGDLSDPAPSRIRIRTR